MPQVSSTDILNRTKCGFANRRETVFNCYYETPDLEFRKACSSAGGGTIEYKYDVAVACNGDGLDEFYSDDGVEKVGAAHYLKYFRECYNLDDRPC